MDGVSKMLESLGMKEKLTAAGINFTLYCLALAKSGAKPLLKSPSWPSGGCPPSNAWCAKLRMVVYRPKLSSNKIR
jgi:hypothetical protein